MKTSPLNAAASLTVPYQSMEGWLLFNEEINVEVEQRGWDYDLDDKEDCLQYKTVYDEAQLCNISSRLVESGLPKPMDIFS